MQKRRRSAPSIIENEGAKRKLKFTKADLDVDMSMLAIGDRRIGKSPQKINDKQAKESNRPAFATKSTTR